nr:unnamed protein product [Callosobruchus chinensis]
MAGGNRKSRNARHQSHPGSQSSSVKPPTQASNVPSFTDPSRYAPLGASVPSLPALEQPLAPKHFPFPSVPHDDEITFEALHWFFIVGSAGFQFLHLYRSVWWLPHSFNKQAVNFYLIDKHLVMFILVILSRRLIYVVGRRIMEMAMPEKVYIKICPYYSICLYLILFGFQIHPAFELVQWISPLPPLHACSTNPKDIREEAEQLIDNFNNRIKVMLFSANVNAYYAGFIPLCFAQSALFFDVWWAAQHVLFIFESSFLGLSEHVLSLRFYDILHRSALHVGTWEKIESSKSMLLVNSSWKMSFKPSPKVVKVCITPFFFVPFQGLFKNPTLIIAGQFIVHLATVLYQLYLLVNRLYWYKIFSLVFVLFYNYCIIYKMTRGYFICSGIYKEEEEMHKKNNMR